MCGRFTRTKPISQLAEFFASLYDDADDLPPSYNAAPTQPVAVVRAETDGRRHVRRMRWGLVPSWAADPSVGVKSINARGETVADKPTFRSAFKQRRCLVLADGFYEWKAEGKRKLPHLFRLKGGEPFALAGLWERWDRGGSPLETCCIVTCDPNALVRPVHDRMPVILPPAAVDRWLAPDAPREELQSLLVPIDEGRMECWEVGKAVGSPRNNGPDLTRPAGATMLF